MAGEGRVARSPKGGETRKSSGSASLFECVVKVNRADDARRRARDIEEGISYACALLMDEYGYPATAVMDIAERISNEAENVEILKDKGGSL